MSSKVSIWVFRISTAMIVFIMIMGAVNDLMYAPHVVEVMQRVGYPMYLLGFLGVMKALGAIALIIQNKLPKMVVEWAYAGIAFDFIGASYSHFASNDPMPNTILPLALFAILAVSRFYKDKV